MKAIVHSNLRASNREWTQRRLGYAWASGNFFSARALIVLALASVPASAQPSGPASSSTVARPPMANSTSASPTLSGSTSASRAFLQCRSCHTLQAGAADNVGPNLFGFLGKRAGTNRASFSYSTQMRASTIVWNDANLDRFLEKPGAVIPGTKMAFIGMARADQRQALIAFLRANTTSANQQRPTR